MEAPRPAPVIRVFVLVAAIVCLGLTMCHAEKKATTPPANQAQPMQAQPTQAPAQQAQPANPPPTYFPATKSAGPIR
jgi:hypothetical protein